MGFRGGVFFLGRVFLRVFVFEGKFVLEGCLVLDGVFVFEVCSFFREVFLVQRNDFVFRGFFFWCETVFF